MVICFKTVAKIQINLGIAKQGLQNIAKSFALSPRHQFGT